MTKGVSAGARAVTPNMLVAYNLAEYRRAAGMTQKQLGEHLGWSEASVSAAERSWDSKRVRKFDADEIVQIADVLGVPVVALLLPPGDSGSISYSVAVGDKQADADELCRQVIPDYQGDTKMKQEFLYRFGQLGGHRFMEPFGAAAGRALEDAREFAKQLIEEGYEVAGRLDDDATEWHRNVMANLAPDYEALERRVSDLREFEREYRRRLIGQLEDGLHYLRAAEEDEGAFPAVLKTPPELTPKGRP